MEHSPLDPTTFRNVMAMFPTGVTVVTTGGESPGGVAIGSFFSVSLDPLLVGFCVGKTSSSWSTMRDAGSFCVNFLASDQVALCAQMAGKGDKYAGVEWKPAPVTGSPVLPDVLAYLDCDHHSTLDGGDHDIVLGLVTGGAVLRPDTHPMVFFDRQYGSFAPPQG